jgi:hypothetical protein
VSLSYAVGKVSGSIAVTSVSFGGFNVDNQAFLHVTDTSTFTANIQSQGYYGLIGLGPNSGSAITKKISKDPRGDTMLAHIFEAHNTTDNYITFLLSRKGDPSETTFQGQLTISEVVPGYENITSMPKIDVDKVNRLLKADQHWQIMTDKDNGIIGPDGQPLKVDSIVPGCPDGQLVAVIDSGFTFSQVPRDISDQIYGRVNGAYYDSEQEFWMIPCHQMLNITFNFGGKSYPVHPLDTVDDNFNQVDSTGQKVCIGSFQPITSAFSMLGHYDMILGMSFLRNAYTLLNFGNWIDVSSGTQDHPFIQLASITDVNQAHADFVNVRLGGKDTTGDAQYQLLPADQMQHSPVSEEEKKKKYQEMVLSRWPYIFVGCLVFVLLITGYCVWRCCCRKGRKHGNSKLAGLFKRNGQNSDGNRALEETEAGFDKASYENSKYHPLSDSNNLSMQNLNRSNTNYSQQSFHPPPPSYSKNNLYSQDYHDGSTYSLQGNTAGGFQQSPYVMNPHAMESASSVHMQRQLHDPSGGYSGHEYASR